MINLSEHKGIDGTTAVFCFCTDEDTNQHCTACEKPFHPRQIVTKCYQHGRHEQTLCWKCEQRRLLSYRQPQSVKLATEY